LNVIEEFDADVHTGTQEMVRLSKTL
jgi:hypothetical protein